MKRAVLGLVAAAAVTVCAGSGRADEVVLANGDRITGSIIQTADGKLTVKTDYAGTIEVELSQVRSVTTDGPADLRLKDGETLKGVLKPEPSGGLRVGPGEGRPAVSVAWEQVAAVNPPPWQPPAWKGSFTVGGHIQSGNTDRKGASVQLQARRKSDKARFSLQFLYNIASEESTLTERSLYGAMAYNYFFTRKAYWLLSLELLSDEFKDLNLRTVVGPGVGYQVWDQEKRSLSLEAGIAYFNEDFKKAPDDRFVTARLAGDLRYRLFDAVDFGEQLILYPDLENFGEYQLRNEATLSRALGSNWSVRLSNIVEYDSQPPEGVKKTDVTTVAGIGYDF